MLGTSGLPVLKPPSGKEDPPKLPPGKTAPPCPHLLYLYHQHHIWNFRLVGLILRLLGHHLLLLYLLVSGLVLTHHHLLHLLYLLASRLVLTHHLLHLLYLTGTYPPPPPDGVPPPRPPPVGLKPPPPLGSTLGGDAGAPKAKLNFSFGTRFWWTLIIQWFGIGSNLALSSKSNFSLIVDVHEWNDESSCMRDTLTECPFFF